MQICIPPMMLNRQHARIRETGYDAATLKDIGVKMSTAPAKFNMHKQLHRILAARIETIQKGEGIDWGTAEVRKTLPPILYMY
jgi:2-oxoglutarate dehydrogenase complex dehydrogenase (E1) component-like enzyme